MACEDVQNFDRVDIEKAELETFAEAAGGGAPYPVPWEDIIHATAVLEAVIKAGKTGETVRL